MKRAWKLFCLVCLLTSLSVASAQDDIEIIIEPDGNQVTLAVNSVRVAGVPSQIRRGLLTENYRILADRDGDGNDESYYSVEYQLQALVPGGAPRNVEIAVREGQLRFSVDGAAITETCDEHGEVGAPGTCVGSGIPPELYGTQSRKMLAFPMPGANGVPVTRVRLSAPRTAP